MALSDHAKRTVRTVLQAAAALAVAVPGIAAASGVPQDSAVIVGALAVAGGFARVFALDSVQNLLAYVGLDTRPAVAPPAE